jgi:hypothetical protein
VTEGKRTAGGRPTRGEAGEAVSCLDRLPSPLKISRSQDLRTVVEGLLREAGRTNTERAAS